MSEHTPGPWEMVAGGVYQIDELGGREILHGGSIKGRGDDAEKRANARLIVIVVAPELLEACKGLIGILTPKQIYRFPNNYQKAKDAIDKAEGERE